MKKLAVVTVLLTGLLLPFTAQPASAYHGGYFWGGFGAGTATGLFVGTALAPRYYYAPAPVYVAPQPVCQDYVTQGYWRQVQVMDPSGAMTLQNQWVPGSVQRVCS